MSMRSIQSIRGPMIAAFVLGVAGLCALLGTFAENRNSSAVGLGVPISYFAFRATALEGRRMEHLGQQSPAPGCIWYVVRLRVENPQRIPVSARLRTGRERPLRISEAGESTIDRRHAVETNEILSGDRTLVFEIPSGASDLRLLFAFHAKAGIIDNLFYRRKEIKLP